MEVKDWFHRGDDGKRGDWRGKYIGNGLGAQTHTHTDTHAEREREDTNVSTRVIPRTTFSVAFKVNLVGYVDFSHKPYVWAVYIRSTKLVIAVQRATGAAKKHMFLQQHGNANKQCTAAVVGACAAMESKSGLAHAHQHLPCPNLTVYDDVLHKAQLHHPLARARLNHTR